jgi:phosphoserine phosphatase RsbU/P
MPRISLRFGDSSNWEDRLRFVVEAMRDTSRANDPNALITLYQQKIREVSQFEAFIAFSRRGLEYPQVRITRTPEWGPDQDPWANKDKLPIIEGGILTELIYANKACVIDDLRVPETDPAHPYIGQYRSAIVTPVFDGGEALNMNLVLSSEPDGFDPEHFPEQVWTTNLFGRATSTLVLQKELKRAYQMLDDELQIVGKMQRSLLPEQLPDIPTLDLAAYYETSSRAGGDYYDFFDLGKGRWGILVADVSGHGTPAAVLMAITHALAHTFCFECRKECADESVPACPAAFLGYLNERLEARYTEPGGTFVTAFFGIYDQTNRTLIYANAGHPPPRVKRCSDGSTFILDGCKPESQAPLCTQHDLPLGILPDTRYGTAKINLTVGDQLVIYTDGITEARDQTGELFGVERLDHAIENCGIDAQGLIHTINEQVNAFASGAPVDDDRTIIVGKVR